MERFPPGLARAWALGAATCQTGSNTITKRLPFGTAAQRLLRFVRRRNGRFVADPQNFIALDVCGTRVQSVTVNLRGRPFEFPELPELPLRSSLAAYSSFRFTKTDQLAAALLYVRRAADIYRRGRGRVLTRERLLDVGCAE